MVTGVTGETWAYEGALEVARERLADRYPGEKVEIVATFDIAYVGWEFDYQGALITHGGRPELVIVDATSGDSRPVAAQLQERMHEYLRLITDTQTVLDRYRAMLESGGYDPAAAEFLREFMPARQEPAGFIVEEAPAEQQADPLYYSISFPLIPGDESIPRRHIRLKYSLAEVLAWLGGGITPGELSDLGLPDAWNVISGWVDEQRRKR